MKQSSIVPVFSEFIPPFCDLKSGVVYISIKYNVSVHKCMCGCGSEIVTPLSPQAWTLIYNGESISLSPSIGNWNYPCKSHYYIRNNSVMWIDVERKKKSKKKTFKCQFLSRNYGAGLEYARIQIGDG